MRGALLLVGILVAGACWPAGEAAAPPPLGLRIEPGAGNATLTWNGSDPTATYRVYRGDGPDPLSFLAVVRNATTYVDAAGLEPGRTYWWAIRMSLTTGGDYWSAVVSATPDSPPIPPRNLTVNDTGTSIVLTWRPPERDGGSPISGYVLYRGPAGGAIVYHATLGNVTTFTEPRPAPPVQYAVAAINGLGIGQRSDPARWPAPYAAPAPAPATNATNATPPAPKGPRLVVEDASVEPANVTRGAIVTLRAAVLNDGDAPLDENLDLTDDGTRLGTVHVALQPGERANVSLQFAALAEGNRSLDLAGHALALRVDAPIEEEPPADNKTPPAKTEAPTPAPASRTRLQRLLPDAGSWGALAAVALAALAMRRR